MSSLKVKNWSRYQHYKDRCPPWIKLATDTFQNYEFSRLQDASKLLAICIWTIAARSKDGSVPYDFAWLKSQGCLGNAVKPEHLKELINQGFLELASDALADCKQSACSEGEGEGEERQRERREETDNALAPLGEVSYPSEFELVWSETGKVGTKSKAFKAWKKAGKPGLSFIAPVYRAYMLSADPARGYVKHLSTWLNDGGHRQDWSPAKNGTQRDVSKGWAAPSSGPYPSGEQEI